MATSYANAGGTGNRTSIITVTQDGSNPYVGTISKLVDGNIGYDASVYWKAAAASGTWIKFDFLTGNVKVIDEVKYYQSNNMTHGVYKFQGSNNDSTWDDLGSTFTLGQGANGFATPQVITTMSANTTAYRYYRFLGTSGTNSSSPDVVEFEFKIEAGSAAAGLTPRSVAPLQAVNRASTY